MQETLHNISSKWWEASNSTCGRSAVCVGSGAEPGSESGRGDVQVEAQGAPHGPLRGTDLCWAAVREALEGGESQEAWAPGRRCRRRSGGAGPAPCGEEAAGSTPPLAPPAPPPSGREVADGVMLRKSPLNIDDQSVSVLQWLLMGTYCVISLLITKGQDTFYKIKMIMIQSHFSLQAETFNVNYFILKW